MEPAERLRFGRGLEPSSGGVSSAARTASSNERGIRSGLPLRPFGFGGESLLVLAITRLDAAVTSDSWDVQLAVRIFTDSRHATPV